MRLERKEGDPPFLAYPDLRFESAWKVPAGVDVDYLFLVFSGRVFECGSYSLEEVTSLPSGATQIPFRDDHSSGEFERPPVRFVGASIAHVANWDPEDRWIFLDGGHLIYWGINCFLESLNQHYHDEIALYSETEFLDDSERASWPVDIHLSDLTPTPIRFLPADT